MVQYFEDDTDRTTGIQAGLVAKDEYWKIKSVSADVQIIDRDVWLGLLIPYGENNMFRYIVSDKKSANNYESRIYLWKDDVNLDYEHVKDTARSFLPGQWYNLRMVFDEGWIRCYIDDVLVLEAEDAINPVYDEYFTAGSAGFFSSEGAARFDNLVVRGEKAEGALMPEPAIRDAEDFTYDFSDDTDGQDPEYWIEEKVGDNWLNDWIVKDIEGNKVYATNGTTAVTHSWLHVFETDVDYAV